MRFSLFRFTFPVFHNILIIDPPHESWKPYCPGLLRGWTWKEYPGYMPGAGGRKVPANSMNAFISRVTHLSL